MVFLPSLLLVRTVSPGCSGVKGPVPHLLERSLLPSQLLRSWALMASMVSLMMMKVISMVLAGGMC